METKYIELIIWKLRFKGIVHFDSRKVKALSLEQDKIYLFFPNYEYHNLQIKGWGEDHRG